MAARADPTRAAGDLPSTAPDAAEAQDAPSPKDQPPTPDVSIDSGPPLPDSGPDTAAPAVQMCPGTYGVPVAIGTLNTSELAEASGVVASHKSPGVLWLHNDSGDTARLFGVSTKAKLLGEVRLTGVDAYDFEDVALARCPNGADQSCLWVGDVGDNARARGHVTLYVVEEPSKAALSPSAPLWTVPVAEIPFTYASGPVDTEALVVAPEGDAFWVLEKVDQPKARLFGTPEGWAGGSVELQELATFDAPGVEIPMGQMITAADLHPTGTRLLVRVYTGSYEYRFSEPLDLSSMAGLEPLEVAMLAPLSELQGEAIAYDEAGTGVWTIAEQEGGEQRLHHYDCVE